MLCLGKKARKIVLPVIALSIVAVSVINTSAVDIKLNDDGTLTATEKFESKTENSKYGFKEEIEYDGKKYILSSGDVESEVLTKKPDMVTKRETFEETVEGYEKVTSADGKKVTDKDDNKTYDAVVDDIKSEEITIKNRKGNAEYTRKLTVPIGEESSIEQEWTFDYDDEQLGETVQVTAPIKEQVVGADTWVDSDYPINITVNGYGADTITMNGQVIKVGEDVPFGTEAYGIVLNYCGLDTHNYKIKSVSWNGSPYDDGGVIRRDATALVQRRSKVYTITYGGEVKLPDAVGYKTTITYGYDKQVESDTDATYYIKSQAIYNPAPDDNTATIIIVSISVGLAVLIITAAVILFVLSRKKKYKI